MNAIITYRYLSSNEWAERNPQLDQGEIGIEADTNLSKIGDGATCWNDLPYAGGREEDQKYFFSSLAYAPKYSTLNNLRGIFTFIYTGSLEARTDRAFMYLNRTKDGQTVCELVPISYFASIRDQAEIN